MMQREDMRRVAAHAKVDFRTVRNAYEGKEVRKLSMDRISQAAMSLGLFGPGGQEPLRSEAPAQNVMEQVGSEFAPPKSRGFIPTGAGNVRPSTRQFLELPITVQHAWDSYPLVNSAIQALAEWGQFRDAAMLVDAVRTDDRVFGCLSTRINAIFGLPMEFKYQGQEEEHASSKPAAPPPALPGEAPTSSKDNDAPTQHVQDEDEADPPEVVALKKKVLKLVEDNWERMLPSATMKDIASWGVMLNLGLGELVWAWDGPLVFPTIKSWHPQFVYWRWDTRSFWLVHQGGQVELAPGDGRWVLFMPNGHNHGWLYGLIRALAVLWLDRKFLWRDWARASEKFALGVIKAFEPPGALAQDKTAFNQSLANMASETTIRLPLGKDNTRGFDIEMLKTNESSVNTDAFFETRIKRIDVCIAVCILGQNLSTEISSSAGSRAAAMVHENVRADFLKADVAVLKQLVTESVLSPFVRYNFEAEADALGIDWKVLVPDISWKVDPPTDLEKEASGIQKIAAAVKDLAGTEANIHELLDNHNIPVVDKTAVPAVPPAVPGLNPERPRAPGGVINAPPPGIGDPVRPDDSVEQPLETEDTEPTTMKDDIANRTAQGLKPGARKGQLYVDDLADAAKWAAAKAMKGRVAELLTNIQAATSYEDLRVRLKTMYRDLSPGELRKVTERAWILAELVGKMSARHDHRGE